MKMKKKYIAFALILGVVLAATAVWASARAGAEGFGAGRGHMFDHRMGWIARQLDLTDGQKTQIKALIQAERPNLEPLVRELAAGRQQMLAATRNGGFDEAQVRTLANQQSQVLAEMMVARERLIAKVYNTVLTPEQRTKADALRQRMTERMSEKLQKHASPGTTQAK